MPGLFPAAFRAEARANLSLAAPLIAAQIAAVGMGAVDTVFAGRLGAHALAAVAVGFNVHVVFLVFVMGLMMACSPIVAQRLGAGRSEADIGAFFAQARRVAIGVGALWALAMNLIGPPVLRALHLEAETTELAIRFLRYLSGSAFGFTLWFALRFCAEGLGETKPILVAGVAGLACNALLDWLLLFGHFGMPALGAPGCGIATSVSTLVMAAVLHALYGRHPRLAAVRAAARTVLPDAGATREIFRLGTPIALTILAEAGLFVLTAMLMARFGDAVVASYQVAINFASLMFMIPMGVAMATTVRVGQAAGAGLAAAARSRGFAGIQLGLMNALSNALLMLVFPLTIADFYTRDADIAARVAGFFVLTAAFQIFDGAQVAANGALRGIKDTRLPLAITLVAYWLVGLPVAIGLAFFTPLGPSGLWWGLTAGLGVAAVGLCWRFAAKTAPAAWPSASMHAPIGSDARPLNPAERGAS